MAEESLIFCIVVLRMTKVDLATRPTMMGKVLACSNSNTVSLASWRLFTVVCSECSVCAVSLASWRLFTGVRIWCVVCAVSLPPWCLFTGVRAWCVLCVRCPWPLGACSPVCAPGLLCVRCHWPLGACSPVCVPCALCGAFCGCGSSVCPARASQALRALRVVCAGPCVCVCVCVCAFLGGPASRAHSGAPHRSCCRCGFLSASSGLRVPLFFVFFSAPPLSPPFRCFRPWVPWASALCGCPPPFFFLLAPLLSLVFGGPRPWVPWALAPFGWASFPSLGLRPCVAPRRGLWCRVSLLCPRPPHPGSGLVWFRPRVPWVLLGCFLVVPPPPPSSGRVWSQPLVPLASPLF